MKARKFVVGMWIVAAGNQAKNLVRFR